MLRILVIALCLGTGSFCFSYEDNRASFELNEDSYPFIYIGYGMANALGNNHDAALGYLESAESLQSDSDLLKPVADFMIAFTRTVIYDKLGWQNKCEKSLGRLFLIAADNDDNGTIEILVANGLAKQLMRNLACMAPSSSVRKILFLLLEDDEDDEDDS